MRNSIAVAYSGVHQAYQLALAVEELGELDQFYCSFFAGTGKWGRVLAHALDSKILMSRQVAGLSAAKIAENPWPLFAHHCRTRLMPKTANDWIGANGWFDRWVARRLRQSGCSVFVGVETCAAKSFAVARDRGIVRVLDCPGIDTDFLNARASEAADQFGLRSASMTDRPEMSERKRREIQLADAIFVCSEFQARLLKTAAKPAKGIHVLPLWADTSFWRPVEKRTSRARSLKVLFAGKINVRKGVPYLLRAASSCGESMALTLVGPVDDEIRPLLSRYEGKFELLPPCTKTELRRHYRDHDLLVLPSLGDSFGFVAMEAMACGLPVIVTDSCGVPVPDPSWRVPTMQSDALARRIALYCTDRSLSQAHGLIAVEFARQFTPARYRENVKKIFRTILPLAA